MVCQISEKKWLTKGGQNSNFFNVSINKHRHNALINSLHHVDGTILDTPEKVHDRVVQYFEQFLTMHQNNEYPNLSYLISKVINEQENGHIMAPPSELELK